MKPFSRLMLVVVCAFPLVQLSGCSVSRGKVLEIDVSEIQGRQHMPDELTRMLSGLGYEWVPVADPRSTRDVKVSQADGQYRMRFRHTQHSGVRIDVRIDVVTGYSWLDFYETGQQALSPSAMHLLQALKTRADLQFGAGNVRVGRWR